MQFNTCIARLMEFTNALSKYMNEEVKNASFLKECILDFIRLIASFAPHFAEEEWELCGMTSSVFNEKWPEFDTNALVKDEIEIAVQINGKVKARINIASGLSEDDIKASVLNSEDVKKHTEGKNILKVIVIKGKLVNIVVK
ncbi:leucyl-tRNA ligase [Clostridium tetanomorphum DSM 665]|nr:leucyl-tRNA ligase [Clostridium tetanomorphum DSM 665]